MLITLPVLEAPQASAASQQPQPQPRKKKEADEDEATRLSMAGQLGPKDFETSRNWESIGGGRFTDSNELPSVLVSILWLLGWSPLGVTLPGNLVCSQRLGLVS